MNRQLDIWHFIPFFIAHFPLYCMMIDELDHWLYSLKKIIVVSLCNCSLESEFIEKIVEDIRKILKEEESATAPSRRQHSVPIISPQTDASSRHNDISEWAPFFFFFKNKICLGLIFFFSGSPKSRQHIFKYCQKVHQVPFNQSF